MPDETLKLTLALDTEGLMQDARRAADDVSRQLERTIKVPKLDLAGGPAQRYDRAQLRYRNAMSFGTPSQQFDAAYAAQKAAQQLQKAMEPNQGGNFRTTPLSSQGPGFGGPGGFGTLASLPGEFAAGLKTVTAELTVLAGVLQTVTAAGERLRDIQTVAGTTPEEAAKLDVFGGAAGIGGPQMSGMALRLSQSLSSDPWSQIMFGMRDMPGPLGKADKSEQLFQAIAKLRAMPYDEAVKASREAGIPEALKFRSLNDKGMADLYRLAQSHAQNMRGSEAISTATTMGKSLFQQMLEEAANKVTQWVTGTHPGNAGTMVGRGGPGGGSPFGGPGGPGGPGGAYGPGGGGYGSYGTGAGAPGQMMGGGVNGDPLLQAIRNLTDATNKNAVLFKNFERHFHGGGERLRNFSPAHLRYRQLDSFLGDSKMAMGQQT